MSKSSATVEHAFRLGQQHHRAGRFADAEYLYRQVLAAAPRHAEALHALGALALQADHPQDAEALIGQALAIRPSATFQITRAHALLALRRPTDAEACARTALKSRPRSAPALQVLGHALMDAGRADAAERAYREALRLAPDLPDIKNNLGTALRQAGRLTEAVQVLRQAPADPDTLVNLSSVQKELGDMVAAEATLRRALTMAPDNPVLLYNWSLLLLLTGREPEAWPAWEMRFRAGATLARAFPQPQWSGDALAGRRLLVHSEQGLGDIIQFARYLPAIAGDVVFEAPPRLIRLLSSCPGMPPMIPTGADPGRFDVVAPLMSLPGRMRIPPPTAPYLSAEPDRVAAWRARLPAEGLRIAIAWQGNAERHEDRGRSIDLARFAPLAAVQGVRLISLQVGQGSEQIGQVPFAVTTLPGLDEGDDAFLDTAAVMAAVDLVVTSDTSIAHLAGALGRPTWVALRKVPDWRWRLDRADSPWYPSMRLFRQTTDGDWAPVFQAIAQAAEEIGHEMSKP